MFLQTYLVKLVKQDGQKQSSMLSAWFWSSRIGQKFVSLELSFLKSSLFISNIDLTTFPHGKTQKALCLVRAVRAGRCTLGIWYSKSAEQGIATSHHEIVGLKVLCAKGVLFLCMATCWSIWLYLQILFFFNDVGPCGVVVFFYIKHINKIQ